MLVAVLLPDFVGLFLLASDRCRTRVAEPRDQDAGDPGSHGFPNDDRTGRHPAAPYPPVVMDSRASNAAGPPRGDGTLPPPGSAVTAMHPAACPMTTSEAQFHGDRHNGNEADMDRRGPGRPIGGRDPWTHR